MPTIIINGGAPLEGCPESWEQAREIEEKLNGGKDKEEMVKQFQEPVWSFDCGFKLDYDGPILRISSRFYPPKTHYGPTWDGTVKAYILDKQITEKKFDCKSLTDLKTEVDTYVNSIREKIEHALKDTL